IVRKQEGEEIQLAVLEKNDYFGEMGLIARRTRSGTVVATRDTRLLILSRESFENYLRKFPQLRSNMDIAVRSRQLARTLRFKWLRQDEVVYFLARKHRIVLINSLIAPALSLLVPIAFLYAWISILSYTIVALASLLSFIAIVGWIFWTWVDWGNDYYVVTNQRVVWLEKVIGIYDSRQESPLSTILSVNVETSQLGRILDYGDVLVRTWIGTVPFKKVDHPEQAQHMIEEYWDRTKNRAVDIEKEAMKEAIRNRLGLSVPTPPEDEEESEAEAQPKPEPKPETLGAILRILGLNRIRLRFELGENVIYRKHWVVLILDAWMPFAGFFGLIFLLIYRSIQLYLDPVQAVISFDDGFLVDTWVNVYVLLMIPMAFWLLYAVLDWSNDTFEVTNEQIIDIDRKPLGTESRNAAQLESILGTHYERHGLLGNIFNFGTVHITVGGSKLAFEDVIDPAAVQSDIDRRRLALKNQREQAAVASERNRMAEWLATYHRNAQEFRAEEENDNGSEFE
ncbi:MAG TPA: cyclic nucleotide-binding domain-containing protein, partial [Anaerolineales bacterium]|nr:cyclic nucleotide-binding domain-containing protein [Anaerolineales bacterium]